MPISSGWEFLDTGPWKAASQVAGPVATAAGVGYAVHQAHVSMQEGHHKAISRTSKRFRLINRGEINPAQYVLQASQDDIPGHKIKSELMAWGGYWDGTDYSDPNAFDVSDQIRLSKNPIRGWMGYNNSYCTLRTHPVNRETESRSEFSSFDARLGAVPTPVQKGKKMLKKKGKGTSTNDQGTSTGDPGIRGGSTEGLEVQETTPDSIDVETQGAIKNGINMSTDPYKFDPSLVYEVSEQQVEAVPIEAVPDQHFTKTYSFKRPSSTPPIVSYGLYLVFIVGSTVLVKYAQRWFSQWDDSKDSQKPASEDPQEPTLTDLQEPLPTTKKIPVFGQHHPKLSNDMVGREATPDNFLEVLTRYKRGLITKKATVYVLSKFYGLSTTEALEMLDESQG